MKTKCPKCKQVHEVEDDALGKQAECPCGELFTVANSEEVIKLKKQEEAVANKFVGCSTVVMVIGLLFFLFYSKSESPSNKKNTASVSPAQPRTAVSNQWGRLEINSAAFRNESDMIKFMSMALSKDFDAGDAFLRQSMLTGNADLLNKGTEVYVEKLSMGNGISQVRKRSDTQSWWVVMDAVKKKD